MGLRPYVTYTAGDVARNNSHSVSDLESGVVDIFGQYGFAGAIKSDGTIIVWGGGVADSLKDFSLVKDLIIGGTITDYQRGNPNN